MSNNDLDRIVICYHCGGAVALRMATLIAKSQESGRDLRVSISCKAIINGKPQIFEAFGETADIAAKELRELLEQNGSSIDAADEINTKSVGARAMNNTPAGKPITPEGKA